MSTLRPECGLAKDGRAIPNDTALFLIRDSVERRRGLIYGRLDDENGEHCAIGAFWADNPKAVLYSSLVDEVAAVNDSVPESATPQERWKKVRNWLRWKIQVLSGWRKEKKSAGRPDPAS
jgi:hypothetical protein